MRKAKLSLESSKWRNMACGLADIKLKENDIQNEFICESSQNLMNVQSQNLSKISRYVIHKQVHHWRKTRRKNPPSDSCKLYYRTQFYTITFYIQLDALCFL